MQIRRRFKLLLCAGLVASAALSGCGSSSKKETIPSSVTIFYSHSVIVKGGAPYAMGYNAYGQLGDRTLNNRSVAASISIPSTIVGGAAGAEHTIVYSNDGRVWSWGYDQFGQLGDGKSGSDKYSTEPYQVSMSGVKGVAAGGYHSLAMTDSAIYAWGYNVYGQVGDVVNNTLPTELKADADGAPLTGLVPVQVAAGGLHSMALFDNGDVYAWGSNASGQVGMGLATTFINRPRKVTNIPKHTGGKIEKIAAMGRASLALVVVRDSSNVITAQYLYGWGYNGTGELGTGVEIGKNTFTPVEVMKIEGVTAASDVIQQIVTGTNHILLRMGPRDNDVATGTKVMAIGYNDYGQLGNNTTTSSTTPVTALLVAGNVTDIAAFGTSSLALVGGAWYGWGNNGAGQLGNPVPTDRVGYLQVPTPVQFQ